MNAEADAPASTAGLLVRLRSAAVEYVRAGWPIVPLSLDGDRLIAGLSPIDPETAFEWWSDQPYGIGYQLGERFGRVGNPGRFEYVTDRPNPSQPPAGTISRQTR